MVSFDRVTVAPHGRGVENSCEDRPVFGDSSVEDVADRCPRKDIGLRAGGLTGGRKQTDLGHAVHGIGRGGNGRLTHPSDCHWAPIRSAQIMLNVLIARHGQSEWNAVGKWQGQADPPLSDLGRAQAAGAVSQLGAFDAIVASDLDRALTTAMIIADGIGIGPVLVDTDFRERNAGEYQGLTRDDIEAQFPGNLDAGIWPPGWEPDEDVQARVHDALRRVIDEIGSGDVLVISHGGVIYSLEAKLGASHDRIANLGARWFHYDDRGWRLGDRAMLAPDNVTIENQDIV
jgi:broad specificity phosphatase PhoE